MPFSCKTRGGFCNSCSEKRSLIFGERIANEILEDANHKHYVFSIPKIMEDYFRLEVLGMLKKEGLISEDLIQNLLTWKNSGFSVYSEGRVVANDDNGRERLAKYMIRSPILMTRLTSDREKQVVHYRTDKGVLDFDPVEFLARLSVHVPNTHEQTVRYMGPRTSYE